MQSRQQRDAEPEETAANEPADTHESKPRHANATAWP
jgi:hypothetical protein